MSEPPGFWPFSKAVYAQQGVQPACLRLQSAGLDVNVALFIVWTIATGRDPAPVLGEVLARAALWRGAVVQPLRNARNGLKPAPDFIDPNAAGGLRKAVLKAELEAERLQQQALEPLAGLCPARRGPDRRTCAVDRLTDAAERIEAGPAAAAAIRAFAEVVFSRLENV